MSDLEAQLSKLIRGFSAQVAGLVGEAARETLSNALGGTRMSSKAASRGAAPALSRGKGDKRPRAAIEATKARLVEFIGKNPGLRVEQLNKQLGTTTKDVALPLKKLVAEKAIKTKGQRRATAYFLK